MTWHLVLGIGIGMVASAVILYVLIVWFFGKLSL